MSVIRLFFANTAGTDQLADVGGNPTDISLGLIILITAVCTLLVAGIIKYIIHSKKKKNKNEDKDVSAQSPTSYTLNPYRIRLFNEDDVSQLWEISLANTILIGRNPDCHVCVKSITVGRKQSKIYVNNDGIAVIENLGKTNATMLNGRKVYGSEKISSGDRIKFGHVVLIVESISSDVSSDLHNGTIYINV